MKLQEIKEIASDTGVHAERGYHLKNFANRIVELDRQQRPWVGLTRDEQSFVYSSLHDSTSRKDSFWVDFANAIEAKLKEKNT